MKLKAIFCFFRRHHKYSYYTDKCVTCGKRRRVGWSLPHPNHDLTWWHSDNRPFHLTPIIPILNERRFSPF